MTQDYTDTPLSTTNTDKAWYEPMVYAHEERPAVDGIALSMQILVQWAEAWNAFLWRVQAIIAQALDHLKVKGIRRCMAEWGMCPVVVRSIARPLMRATASAHGCGTPRRSCGLQSVTHGGKDSTFLWTRFLRIRVSNSHTGPWKGVGIVVEKERRKHNNLLWGDTLYFIARLRQDITLLANYLIDTLIQFGMSLKPEGAERVQAGTRNEELRQFE